MYRIIAEGLKNIKERRNIIMNKKWLKAAGVRALKTVCQTAVSLIGVSVVLSDVAWLTVLSASILSGILSVLTSIAGLPEVEEGEAVE